MRRRLAPPSRWPCNGRASVHHRELASRPGSGQRRVSAEGGRSDEVRIEPKNNSSATETVLQEYRGGQLRAFLDRKIPKRRQKSTSGAIPWPFLEQTCGMHGYYALIRFWNRRRDVRPIDVGSYRCTTTHLQRRPKASIDLRNFNWLDSVSPSRPMYLSTRRAGFLHDACQDLRDLAASDFRTASTLFNTI